MLQGARVVRGGTDLKYAEEETATDKLRLGLVPRYISAHRKNLYCLWSFFFCSAFVSDRWAS